MSRALVTGGSGGIGESVVRRLGAAGSEVTFTYCRGAERGAALASETGARALPYDQTDMRSLDALTEVIESEDFDVLVNNGSGVPEKKLLLKSNRDAFMTYLESSVRGPLQLSSAFAGRARDRGTGGYIVNVLTSYVLGMPPRKLAAYVTSKYALLGLTRSMAAEFVRYGIRVNAVSPAMTRTSFISDLPERFVEQFEAGLPFGRLATADEVAAVIEFLASPAAAYLNGVNIPIAGGQAC